MAEVITGVDPVETRRPRARVEDASARESAVSWAAILAGAAGAAALSVLLLILGTELGLFALSPWAMEGVNATTIGFAAIAWLTFMQIGRLKTFYPA